LEEGKQCVEVLRNAVDYGGSSAGLVPFPKTAQFRLLGGMALDRFRHNHWDNRQHLGKFHPPSTAAR
jgi:hypothetical protein